MKPTLYEGQTSVGESTTSFYPSVSRFEKAGLLQTFGIFKTLVLGRKAKSSWPNRSFQTTQGAYWCTLYITFFQLATDCNTRGHSLKISKHYCKTDMRKFFISYKVIIRWHSLPEEAIQVDSINSFKKHLQKIELELELEKSDRYCYLLTTKGKKAESLYKSPDFFQMTIKSFFKTI